MFAHTDTQFHSAVYGVEPMSAMLALTSFKHERMAPKGDTFVGKLQGMAIAIDSKVIIKVKTSGFGIDKELMGAP